MSLTRRGERLLVTVVVILCVVVVAACAVIGQHWKAERLSEAPPHQTQNQTG